MTKFRISAKEAHLALFKQLCVEVTEIAHKFGFGVLQSDSNLIVYAGSAHMSDCANDYIPPGNQYFIELDEPADKYVLYRLPVISRSTSKIHLSCPVKSKLENLDTEELEHTATRMVKAIKSKERQLDRLDQEKAILSITESQNLLENTCRTRPTKST